MPTQILIKKNSEYQTHVRVTWIFFSSILISKGTHTLKFQAQAILLDYLHSIRSIEFMDAENMSKKSPHFLEKSRKWGGIGRSIIRLLRYHPINEFEPFFEGMGLKPSEYVPLLPRNLMFLRDSYPMQYSKNIVWMQFLFFSHIFKFFFTFCFLNFLIIFY